MNPRKLLLKLARRIESAWQPLALDQAQLAVPAGWYILEFVLEGAQQSAPRILVTQADGKTATRSLIGAHSGRNRMLVYLPEGQLRGYSQAIEFTTFSRIPAWEGRARVLLICWRYLLDFFNPLVLLRMLAIQFKPPFALSTAVLEFYSPPETTILETIDWWQRHSTWRRCVAWWLRDIRIGVLVEDLQQKEALLGLSLVPEVIVAASEECLPDQADYWVILASTERLRSTSLLLIKLAIWRARRQQVEPLLLYSDHDYAAAQSEATTENSADTSLVDPNRLLPVFKPQASLAYLYCFAYIGPAAVYHQSLLPAKPSKVWLDEDVQYQLQLQALQSRNRAVHIPELLFTSSRTEPLATPAPHSEETPWPGIVWQRAGDHNKLTCAPSAHSEVEAQPPESLPSVDLVVPTRDGLQFLRPCVEGLLYKTDYPDLHIYIVDNGSAEAQTIEWLQKINTERRVSVLSYPGEFNFSAINNTAVAQGSGEYIGLINNDIEVIHSDWLRQMVAWASQETVGVVGAKLLFGNGLVQHAGVTIGMGNAAGHIHRLEAGDAPGYQNRCIATQNMMAVTAACMLTPRTLYEQLGGLNEQDFKVAYNDIDYCLRAEAMGLDVIWTPEARLYHLESVSRGDDMSEQHIDRYFRELANLQKRWKTRGFVDKYYNKHLRIGDEGVYPQVNVVGEDALREYALGLDSG